MENKCEILKAKFDKEMRELRQEEECKLALEELGLPEPARVFVQPFRGREGIIHYRDKGYPESLGIDEVLSIVRAFDKAGIVAPCEWLKPKPWSGSVVPASYTAQKSEEWFEEKKIEYQTPCLPGFYDVDNFGAKFIFYCNLFGKVWEVRLSVSPFQFAQTTATKKTFPGGYKYENKRLLVPYGWQSIYVNNLPVADIQKQKTWSDEKSLAPFDVYWLGDEATTLEQIVSSVRYSSHD